MQASSADADVRLKVLQTLPLLVDQNTIKGIDLQHTNVHAEFFRDVFAQSVALLATSTVRILRHTAEATVRQVRHGRLFALLE